MTTASELASLLGFGEAYSVLRNCVRDYGNPGNAVLRKLPEDFLREALNVTDTSKEELEAGLKQLQKLVAMAPEDESERLAMAFNFEESEGHLTWTRRAGRFASARGIDESIVRKKVDTDILQLLIRTNRAAEKQPEATPTVRLASAGSRAAGFFDQGYVRNSEEFIGSWSTATTVDISGFGHNRMLLSYSAEIRDFLQRGGHMRALLQDPDGTAVIQANFRSSTAMATDDEARHQQRIGIRTFAALRKTTAKGEIKVRSYDIVPPFTAYFFDADSDNGVGFVWFWSWRQSSSERPGFVVRRTEDQLWFSRFHSQFTALWEDDTVTSPISLEAES